MGAAHPLQADVSLTLCGGRGAPACLALLLLRTGTYLMNDYSVVKESASLFAGLI